MREYKSFQEFYPFYLTQHAHPTNRVLHFIGTFLVIVCLIASVFYVKPIYLLLCPLFGYGFAWFGHFVLEKNKPATFKYPLYSLGSDFVMFWHILTGQITDKLRTAHQQLGIQNPWK